ncbi:histidine--tRNA ligase [Brevibacterium litoralis]|uniref:histidine--tRNA ligase n=1 Tax=Brevibacterium litoralis TaxID=3138935 RepID=UPI0032EED968
MSTVARLSGFPERLPADRIVEEHVIDRIRHTFELNGFASLHTRAVEPLSALAKDGEIDKEVFAVTRLHQDPNETVKNPLGLHFDLTVPFARYVVENSGHLDFPFKRFQIQPVWRGERPQGGRYREFVQADWDIVGDGTLPDHFEVEVPLVLAQIFESLADLGVPPVRILVNNRKLLEGFTRGLGLEDVTAVLRALDKLDKIGPEKVGELLATEAGADASQQEKLLALAGIESSDSAEVAAAVRALGVEHALLDEGLDSLVALLDAAARLKPGVVLAQLKIARGLDYYTGCVYETQLVGHEDLGSVASGGRYDSLATDGKRTFPGVGMSLGVSRLMSRLVGKDRMLEASRKVPTAVLVAVTDETQREAAAGLATTLRSRDIPTDVSPSAAKFGKQIKFADKRGIPFVWFTDAEGGHSVKDIRSGEQVEADPATWTPPTADIRPTVRRYTGN